MTDAFEAVSLTVAKQIDETCDRFEQAWKAGQKPRIEDYIGAVDGVPHSALLRALLRVELELVSRAGGTLLTSSYQNRFPAHAELVAAVLKESASDGAEPPSAGTVSLKQSAIDTSHSHPPSQLIPTVGSIGGARPPGNNAGPREWLGRFEILKRLGQGAFGTVYHARDPQLDREVAIKVPRVESLGSDQQVQRFLREARAAATLRHANICPVYEISEVDGRHAIVMAFIAGKPLSALTRGDKQLSQRQVAILVRKLALALQTAHQKQIVHRDLKPDNIMIDRERQEPVITDFGLARMSTADDVNLTASGQIMGTPAYMPPEQARGEIDKIGPASDIYSLGVIFYELLCGQRPFTGSSIAEVLSQVLLTEPSPPAAHRPSVDSRLEAICLKAMAKKIEDRYASMAEFAAALAEYLRAEQTQKVAAASSEIAGPTAQTQPAAPVPEAAADLKSPLTARGRRRAGRRFAVIAATLLVGVLVLAALVTYYVRTDYGTLVVEINDERVAAKLKQDGLTIEDADSGRSFVINAAGSQRNSTGEYQLAEGQGLKLLVLDDDGLEIATNEFKLTRGGKVRVRVTLDAPAAGLSTVDSPSGDATPPRSTNSGQITELRELNSRGQDDAYPWVIRDGRTIYFTREAEGVDSAIYRAERQDDTRPFSSPKRVLAGRQMVVSEDETYAILLPTDYTTNVTLSETFRRSTTDAWSEPRPIAALAAQPNAKSPWLSNDGLTLVFQRARAVATYPGKGTEFAICHRGSRQAPWENPQLLPMTPDPSLSDFLTWPQLSADQLSLCFCHGGDRFGVVHVADRPSLDAAFSNYRALTVDGKPLTGRSPRYFSERREIYLSHDVDAASKDSDLYLAVADETNTAVGIMSSVTDAAMTLTGKLPAPPADRVAELQGAVREAMQTELASGESSKLSDAAQLLLTRADTLDSPDEQFALVALARDLLAQAGDVERALDACSRLERQYVFDAGAEKVRTLRRLSRATMTPRALDQLRPATVAAGFELLAADRYPSARDAAKLAADLAQSSSHAAHDYQARFLAEEVDRAESAYARLPAAVQRADVATDDPDTNTARGHFMCLIKNDWLKGLEFLRAGTASWQTIAEQEEKRPDASAERIALGDLWWQSAEGLPEPYALGARRRARYWYLAELAKIEPAEREAIAAQLQLRIDQVPRTPITLRIGMTGLSGYHTLRISSDGVRTLSRGTRKITKDIRVNHLRWTDHVADHRNAGAARLLPDGVDFSTTQLVDLRHGHWGAAYIIVTPQYVDLMFWHSPANETSNFDVTLTAESSGYDLPSRFSQAWEVAYYNWTENSPPTDDKARTALFQSEPVERARTHSINFVSESSPTQNTHPGKPSEKIGFDRYALVANSVWQLPAGRYQAKAFADDGIRVHIDDQLVLDNWRTKGDFRANSGDIDLSAGPHQIRLEYFQITGSAMLQFDLVRLGD